VLIIKLEEIFLASLSLISNTELLLAIRARIAKKYAKEVSESFIILNTEKQMAENYAIIRQQKRYTPSEINGIWAENIRSIMAENVDIDRSDLNITLAPLAFDNYDHYVETRRKQINLANKKRSEHEKAARFRNKTTNHKTGARQYLSLMQEFVFTHSNGALDKDESIKYCKLAYEFVVNWFTECNVFLAIIHLDEKTPHVHIWVDYFNKFDNRFEESVLQAKGKTDINKIRDAWYEKIEEEGFNLQKQDGSVIGSKHDGSKADKIKGDLKKQLEEVTRQYSILKSSDKKKDEQILELQKKLKVSSSISEEMKDLKKNLQPWHNFIKDIYKLDIFKEDPPVVESSPRIVSTLTKDTVSKSNTANTTIPSLLK